MSKLIIFQHNGVIVFDKNSLVLFRYKSKQPKKSAMVKIF